jgi:hypothetical protein
MPWTECIAWLTGAKLITQLACTTSLGSGLMNRFLSMMSCHSASILRTKKVRLRPKFETRARRPNALANPPGPQAAAVGQACGRRNRLRDWAIRGVFSTPAQARARQPHGGASSTAAVHRDVEGSTAGANGDRTQPSLAEVEAQWAQARGAAETKAHGDQRLLTQ